ncbi:MAG: biotin transporter BioY [SAR202 cluster bacterium]|nr:biotin transporter BioY [Chloroflexota bacterium]MQG50843.1 biotin transporter BioY [SAR202 cluster bacterium]|tara:strand:- start:1385 stop:2026 length:642 start_codon:yes stop_codon:yes gene_type:complete
MRGQNFTINNELPLLDMVISRDKGFINVIVDFLAIISFVAATGLAAQFKFYLNPAVPVTGQTFVVLMAGAVLGMKKGFIAMSLYAILGWASHIGVLSFSMFAGSFLSKGYVIGFIAAATVIGYFVERGWGRNPIRLAGIMLIGEIFIYLFGLMWLGIFITSDQILSNETTRLGLVYSWGVGNFWIGDTIKLILAAGLVPTLTKLIDTIKTNAR